MYGLAADAMNAEAVNKIFKVKKRPLENPLIVHVSDIEMMSGFVKEVPDIAHKMIKKFWPGPLTVILEKKENVPLVTTGNLETIAIRMPSHSIALKIIKSVNVGLAAPSANISGKPSSTSVAHCIDDFEGEVEYIVDGGICNYGLESTVVSLIEENPIILRPGVITKEQLEEVINKEVKVSENVMQKMHNEEIAISPGMKYKHYSPDADIIIVKSSLDNFVKYVNSIDDYHAGALVFEGEEKGIKRRCFYYGKKDDPLSQGQNIFNCLRDLDKEKIKKAYVRCPNEEGIGLAVYNRLLRAANFNIVILDEGCF